MIYARWIVSIFLIVVWLAANIENIRLIILERRGADLGSAPDLPFLMPVIPWIFGVIGFLVVPFPYHFYFAPVPFLIDPVNWYSLLNIKKIIKNW